MIGYILFFSLIAFMFGCFVGFCLCAYFLSIHKDVLETFYVKHRRKEDDTTPPHNP